MAKPLVAEGDEDGEGEAEDDGDHGFVQVLRGREEALGEEE